MKKVKLSWFLYALAIIFVVVFLIAVLFDYFNYDKTINSAPFSTFLIVRCVEFILPSVIIFLIATITKTKFKK